MPKDPRSPTSDQTSFHGPFTTLTVGEQVVEYTVHEKLLWKNSKFFASASKADWKEGQDHRVPLPDDVPSVVENYLNWLYTRKIFCRNSQDETMDREYEVLISGYIFGEKVQDGGFRNAIVDSLIHAATTPGKTGKRWYLGLSMVDSAYKGTPEGSPLTRLLVDMYVFHGIDEWLQGDINPEFMSDLAKCLLKNKRASGQENPTLPTLNSCRYHHHSEGEDCYS